MRFILIVLDSAGIGELPDAYQYGDEGSNTLGNLKKAIPSLSLPHLSALGLPRIPGGEAFPPLPGPALGAYGRMAEVSAGKDTTTGHWELAGIRTRVPFPTYPQGFPMPLIEQFEKLTGRPVLGNCVASGTEIVARLGDEQVRTGGLIVYTSADSVFQIAAHEDVVPVEELYAICEKARALLTPPHNVSRVIARPFEGSSGDYRRTTRRRDFSLPPPAPNLLTILRENGLPVAAVGKIEDIYCGSPGGGISEAVHTASNDEGVNRTLDYMKSVPSGLIFTNLVDFDMLYGHRNDCEGYAAALEAFDRRLPELLQAMGAEDVLMITADHGCDPTTPSTDHSREYVPLLVCGRQVNPVNLGTRATFADVAATILEAFALDNPLEIGTSFWNAALRPLAWNAALRPLAWKESSQ